MPNHPKIRACGLEARWLFIKGLCHSAEYLTDGLLISTDAAALAGELRHPKDAIEQLVHAGLWQPLEGGYTIHDYLDHNPSGDHVKNKRAARANAGRIGGQRSGITRRNKTEANTSGDASGLLEAKPSPVPVPVPEGVRDTEVLSMDDYLKKMAGTLDAPWPIEELTSKLNTLGASEIMMQLSASHIRQHGRNCPHFERAA
jgi:hypothetical protein